MYDLITIGDSTIDTTLVIDDATVSCDLKKEHYKLCFNYADKIPITYTMQSIGGNAANVAAGTKKLGLKTAIVTELGDDINGIFIKHELSQAGIDTRYVKMLKGEETRYSVVLNFKTERTVLSYYAKRKYSFPKIEKTKWIYYTSLGKSFEKLQPKLISYLKKNPQTKLAFNPGSYQKKYGLETIKKILPQIDLIFVNKEEAQILTNKKQDILSAVHALHKEGVKMIVITDGTNGSWCFDGKFMYHMPLYHVKAVARAGAGDAYSSGFLSAIIYNKTLTEAMQWGSANAAGVVQEFGAQKGLFTKAGIEKMIKTYKDNTPKNIKG